MVIMVTTWARSPYDLEVHPYNHSFLVGYSPEGEYQIKKIN